MLDIPEEELKWLKAFFAGRNALLWANIVSRSANPAWLELVIPWIELLCLSNARDPIILPIFDQSGPVLWYAVARNENAASTMVEEIRSFVGPSYSDFNAQRYFCESSNECDIALQQRFGSYIYCFTPHSEVTRGKVIETVSQYLSVLRRRPETPDRALQPFGKIRGDFDRALLAGNEKSATKLLGDLVSTGRVNAEQQKFLEIRLLAGVGRHEELAHNDALIQSVMDLSLPPQTLTDIIDSLYRRYISGIESDDSFEIVASSFKKNIWKRFGALFKERKGVRHASVLKAFMLYELTQETPNPIRCNAIVSTVPNNSEAKAIILKWSEQLTSRVEPSPMERSTTADQAIADEDYEVAVGIFLELIPDIRAYKGLLRCAVELDDPYLASKVLSLIEDAGDNVTDALNERDKKRISSLRSTTNVPVPDYSPTAGWIEWADAVASGYLSSSAITLLADAIHKWSVDDYTHEPDKCAKLAAIVGNATGVAEGIFRDAFPSFVDFFADRPTSTVRGFVPLYNLLINIVALNGVASADELELVTVLMLAEVAAAPPKDIYNDSLQSLEEILRQNKSPSIMDWALNLAEMLAIQPTPDDEARLRLFMAVADLIRANTHRISDAQRTVLGFLVKDYDCESMLESIPATDRVSDLPDEKDSFEGLIGIYTLTETAGQRARQILQKLLPKARVELNGDFVASDRLRNLAATADVFVFAWRSSKHQAYFCVKEARGCLPLCMPLGKGTASILSSVLTAVGGLV